MYEMFKKVINIHIINFPYEFIIIYIIKLRLMQEKRLLDGIPLVLNKNHMILK